MLDRRRVKCGEGHEGIENKQKKEIYLPTNKKDHFKKKQSTSCVYGH